MSDLAFGREEEEEQEEYEDIPKDSLWAYYGEQSELPNAYIYFGGNYIGKSPVLMVYPSWMDTLSSEEVIKLRGLEFEEFWEHVEAGVLKRVDDPLSSITQP